MRSAGWREVGGTPHREAHLGGAKRRRGPVSRVLAGAPVLAQARSSASALSAGPRLNRERPGPRPFIEPLGDAALPLAPLPVPSGRGVIRVPNAALGLGRCVFPANIASLAAPREREQGDRSLVPVGSGGNSAVKLSYCTALLSSFTWHVGCLRGCAELEGMPVRRSFGRSGLHSPSSQHRPPPRPGPGQFRIRRGLVL